MLFLDLFVDFCWWYDLLEYGMVLKVEFECKILDMVLCL